MLAGLLPTFDYMFVEKAIPIEKLKPEGFFKKILRKGRWRHVKQNIETIRLRFFLVVFISWSLISAIFILHYMETNRSGKIIFEVIMTISLSNNSYVSQTI